MKCDMSLRLSELKLQLKRWELKFVKENGRKPSKDDIAVNKVIQNSYVEYSK